MSTEKVKLSGVGAQTMVVQRYTYTHDMYHILKHLTCKNKNVKRSYFLHVSFCGIHMGRFIIFHHSHLMNTPLCKTGYLQWFTDTAHTFV